MLIKNNGSKFHIRVFVTLCREKYGAFQKGLQNV